MTGKKAGYEATLFRSKFVLCPRGAGTASFRLFETLAAGKVPVIISDEWVPPHGPDWAACSLRVRESDLARIPALLAAAEERWPQLAAAARATHETWFARTVLFHQMMESCSELLAMRAPTLRPRRGGRYWQLGLWNLKHTARSLPGKAFRSLRRCVTRRP